MNKPRTPQVRLLSPIFYERYSDNREILSKQNRPYLVLLVEYRGLNFAIPFRSNIQHSHAYKFQGESSKNGRPALTSAKASSYSMKMR